MRTILLLLLLLICLFPSSRSQAAELTGCRTQFSQPNDHLSLANQIQLDLLSGIWIEEKKANGNALVQSNFLRFTDQFQAQLLQYKANESHTFITYYWNINIQNGNPYLLLTDIETGQQKTLELEQTCKGIELTNQATHQVMNLEHQPFLSPAELTTTRKELIGSWKNTYYPSEKITVDTSDDYDQVSEATFLKYTFEANGSYFKSVKGTDAAIEENGRWELSKDGSTIIFYTNDAKTYSARIRHLQMDELVLEYSLKARELGLCTGLKSFYFNKQY